MATTALLEVGQLDLFADLDAVTAAAADAERQRIFDEAPSLLGDTARGYVARVQAMRAWTETHGHFDSVRRSHGWRDEIGSGIGFADDDIPRSPVCRPVTLSADLRCEHWDTDCCCVGDLVYRGACLHCTWEGEIRDDHNPAVEDAHDHAWPGWRDLPLVDRRPDSGTSAKQCAAMQRWIDHVNDTYPEGWLEAGGPIRTARSRYGTRHVPSHTGFGGYDLCGAVDTEPNTEPVR